MKGMFARESVMKPKHRSGFFGIILCHQGSNDQSGVLISPIDKWLIHVMAMWLFYPIVSLLQSVDF